MVHIVPRIMYLENLTIGLNSDVKFYISIKKHDSNGHTAIWKCYAFICFITHQTTLEIVRFNMPKNKDLFTRYK